MEFLRQHRNHIYIGIAAAALLLSLILCIGFASGRGQRPEQPAETVTEKPEKEKRDRVLISTSAEMIREGLANMGTLITLEYDFTQVETYTKEKNILFITSSSEFVYSYDGSVLAGVDFEKIGIETDEERHAILVKMPKSEIQSVNIDKNTFKIYSERESLWNPLKLEDYNISLIDFENAAKEKALERGVLERADASARNLVGEFITSLPNTAGYSVEFL